MEWAVCILFVPDKAQCMKRLYDFGNGAVSGLAACTWELLVRLNIYCNTYTIATSISKATLIVRLPVFRLIL
jgi:hypothetical protein